ncbi:serine/threonine-protein kinase fused [Leptopilina boulardi]|uniref:serine/threonine-protein kinase fused n=1 Tax=Leptopilina boulardi TaxID=63433 RepID=UPI0021F67BD9|nr:serine/threonine-protein kinase fused [Leptopilina boulardi]XP_051157219.1 serine/threonine-protein kinase fused [Leptopilina boulardi]XP_051157220.1 serine/threonine-protein kinase fused [Leptopilina boulardi]
MEKYEVLCQIGEGSFGQVYKAKKRANGDIVAFKVIRKRGRSEKELKSLRQECEIQRHLHHPNIVQMLDSFETDNQIVVVTEYADKDLYEIIGKTGRLSEERAQVIACDLVSALYYLHSNRVLHRDLKPQNVLLETNGVAKLCDFGFARSMSTGTHVLTSIKGTPLYMAPELIEERPYDHNADLWSLGCIVYELVVGIPPFQTTSILHLIKLIRFESVKWPSHITSICKSFLEGLLQKDPSQRLTWPSLLEHPFVKDRIIIVGTPVPTSLTTPLSASQEKAKQQQFHILNVKSNKSKDILERAVMKVQEHERQLREIHRRGCISQPRFPVLYNYYAYGMNQPCPVLRRSEPNGTDSNTSVDVLLGNLSLRASLQSDLLAADHAACQMDCPNSDYYHETLINPNCPISKIDIEQKPECVSKFPIEISAANNQNDKHKDPEIENENVRSLKINSEKEILKQSRLSKDYDQEFGKENTVDKQMRLPDWNPRAVEQPIENEEWVAFLQKSMEEIMDGEIGSLLQENCVSVFVSPLRNPAVGSQVIEYVACLLALPFVAKISSSNLELIQKVYLDVRVVPNLVHGLKLLMVQGDDNETTAEFLTRSALSLSGEELQAIERNILLLCRLVYVKEQFLTQFCDAIYIISGIPLLQQLLTLENKKPGVVGYLLAIFNNVLRSQPENAEIIEKVVLRVQDNETKESKLEQLKKLLSHHQPVLRLRTCILIKHLGKFCCRDLQHIWEKSLRSSLETLTVDKDSSVKDVAIDVVNELKNLPYYDQ